MRSPPMNPEKPKLPSGIWKIPPSPLKDINEKGKRRGERGERERDRQRDRDRERGEREREYVSE